jgi:hypothetical protein
MVAQQVCLCSPLPAHRVLCVMHEVYVKQHGAGECVLCGGLACVCVCVSWPRLCEVLLLSLSEGEVVVEQHPFNGVVCKTLQTRPRTCVAGRAELCCLVQLPGTAARVATLCCFLWSLVAAACDVFLRVPAHTQEG